MSRCNTIALLIISSLLLSATASTRAVNIDTLTDPVEKGLAIAKEQAARDEGWRDTQAQMIMTLRSAAGKESTRMIRAKMLEVIGDGDKSLSIFDEPRDIKGTSFLTHSHSLEPDDQWLYLPALKRVKRINARTRSGPFMGSEFAYEDMSSFEVEKYTYKYLRDEPVDGADCYVVEDYPRDEFSGYTRRVSWIDKKRFKPLRVDFYDRRDKLLKTLLVSDYRLHLDRYWRANHFLMTNHQTGKATLIVWQDYRFGTGLDNRDFDKSSLKRAK